MTVLETAREMLPKKKLQNEGGCNLSIGHLGCCLRTGDGTQHYVSPHTISPQSECGTYQGIGRRIQRNSSLELEPFLSNPVYRSNPSHEIPATNFLSIYLQPSVIVILGMWGRTLGAASSVVKAPWLGRHGGAGQRGRHGGLHVRAARRGRIPRHLLVELLLRQPDVLACSLAECVQHVRVLLHQAAGGVLESGYKLTWG